MAEPVRYPKRLIEVDLPIRRISAHSRREKSIRHGHISTLHLWWARRPLAACRAVMLASLWPDPCDGSCPASFREAARKQMRLWARETTACKTSEASQARLTATRARPELLEDPLELRGALLDFIADFANWDRSTDADYLAVARSLTRAAHEGLGGHPGTRPLVIDPFAGGGAIPVEALRVGADAFASDLNPIPILLNKVALEYIPQFGKRLADAVKAWGSRIQAEAQRELGAFYPDEPNSRKPVAYLWARTIRCEGPACGAEIPLLKSSWVSQRKGGLVALKLTAVDRKVTWALEFPKSASESHPGTVSQGSATCPVCGFTTTKDRLRAQLKERRGGAADALLYCVVVPSTAGAGRAYRLPTERDRAAAKAAAERVNSLASTAPGALSAVPDEPIPQEKVWKNNPIRVHLYGITRWGDMFSPRQQLALATYARLVRKASEQESRASEPAFAEAVGVLLALALSRLADISNAHCQWRITKTQVCHLFTRQALSMLWDFAEPHIFAEDAAGNFTTTLGTMVEVLERWGDTGGDATVRRQSATSHVLADDMAAALFTDPPYYDAVPYATLADFFYVWLKRSVPPSLAPLFADTLIPKQEECVVDEAKGKFAAFFESTMTRALAEARRVVAPDGIGVVVFAHKSTSGWEAQIKAMLDAGWVVTASWPLDTELGNRMRAQNSAALASSVHLVCRPREDIDGKLRTDSVGDWREVLRELPVRIHEWLPRLSAEGIVGADAIFACLGPALEVFSRYSRVEKASGEHVELKEYLEHVWAAVSREALSMLFADPDTAGLDADARLTAIWLWTVASVSEHGPEDADEDAPEEDDEDEAAGGKETATGFVLEYDAARKIAQGLGVQLESMGSVVEVKGEQARLLAVAERAAFLFGKVESATSTRKAARKKQLALFAELEQAAEEQGWGDVGAPKAGATTLDRVHQAMLLFAAGRGEALKRFLVDDGAGREASFWKLAQSLSALYPAGTNEKRWVDGVLARKKGLGF